MLQVQRFAIDNIYCAPGQDAQHSFKLVRMNKKNLPCKGKVYLYNTSKHLPNSTNFFHVFAVGNIPTGLLNLLAQKESWFRDSWVKVSDDMVARNFIFQLYNQDGVMYPRQNLYYMFIDERSLLIAQELPVSLRSVFPVDSFEYLHVYSNAYFNSVEHNGNPNKVGIDYRFAQVENNLQKVTLQTYITTMKAKGGDVFIYVNGLWTDAVNLNIPDYSYVEIVYDQSVLSRERFNLEGLHTFDSIKDDKLKYILYRQKLVDKIQYFDDTEVYINDKSTFYGKGLFFYKHKDHSMRNVTDKDFSLNSAYVNTTALRLGELTVPGFTDKEIVLYTRKSGRDMDLVYSAMKLHEFYKLPQDVQFNVLTDNGHTVDILRAEYLENSFYFDVANAAKISDVTPELAIKAVGYNGITHYLADTPVVANTTSIAVPELYQWRSTAFEYDQNGLYKGMFPTNGPVYTCTTPNTKFVEFIHGQVPQNFGRLYDHNEVVTLPEGAEEYVVLAAYFTGVTRESSWEDITNTNKVIKSPTSITLNEVDGKKIKIVYLNQVNVYDIELDFSDGAFYFPLTNIEDKGTGMGNYICDVPYMNISVFLNEQRLTMGLDYFIKFPYISICNKKYLKYNQAKQKVHIRCVGVTLDLDEINKQEIRGFVNNGVLTRNKRYDIREDRVYSAFIDGKLYQRDNIYYSEEDNTVRLGHPLNGLPYTLTDNFIPIKHLTGVDSLPIYRENNAVNKKISDLYDIVFPEPTIDEFNVIGTSHFIFSPTISKIINDIVRGVIPSSLYTSPYDNTTILNLLDNNYSELLRLDPIKFSMQDTLVEIHPHLGNAIINLNLFQYRFVNNIIRFITNNKPEKISMSGYVSMSTA